MLIKICGLRDPKTALFAAQRGADFIGMILTPGYRRSIDLAVAKEISLAIEGSGATAVGVFVTETPEQVVSICHTLNLDTVQYYPHAVSLPAHLKRIYVNAPDVALRTQDFLLLESAHPGSGEKIDAQTFASAKHQKFILAGGLNSSNVQEMIQLYRPIGVDVSSGVEENGHKSCALIQEFIDQVRR